MYKNNLNELIGKQVVVSASGTTYRGRLIEVSETDVFIQGELGYIQLPVEDVTSIVPAA